MCHKCLAYLKRAETEWNADGEIENQGVDFGGQMSQRISDRLLQIVEQQPALLDALHDRREVVIHQYDICCLFCNIAA
jgi:hypothetical protein